MRILIVYDNDIMQIINVSDDNDLYTVALDIVTTRYNNGDYKAPLPFPEFGISHERIASYTGADEFEKMMIRSYENHRKEESAYSKYYSNFNELTRIVESKDYSAALAFLLEPSELGPQQPHISKSYLLETSNHYNHISRR